MCRRRSAIGRMPHIPANCVGQYKEGLTASVLVCMHRLSHVLCQVRRLEPSPAVPVLADISAAMNQQFVPQTAGGPRKALNRLEESMTNDAARAQWLLEAEKASIIGSCPKSKDSVRSCRLCDILSRLACALRVGHFRSGNKLWIDFAEKMGIHPAYPPPLSGLLAWSETFR